MMVVRVASDKNSKRRGYVYDCPSGDESPDPPYVPHVTSRQIEGSTKMLDGLFMPSPAI
jgi:hypothetical protein